MTKSIFVFSIIIVALAFTIGFVDTLYSEGNSDIGKLKSEESSIIKKTTEKQIYIYVLTKTSELKKDITPVQQKILAEHFLRLKNDVESGKVILAGLCEDETFGEVIFYDTDLKSAEKYALDDPAVKNKLMTAKVYAFRIALSNFTLTK